MQGSSDPSELRNDVIHAFQSYSGFCDRTVKDSSRLTRLLPRENRSEKVPSTEESDSDSGAAQILSGARLATQKVLGSARSSELKESSSDFKRKYLESVAKAHKLEQAHLEGNICRARSTLDDFNSSDGEEGKQTEIYEAQRALRELERESKSAAAKAGRPISKVFDRLMDNAKAVGEYPDHWGSHYSGIQLLVDVVEGHQLGEMDLASMSEYPGVWYEENLTEDRLKQVLRESENRLLELKNPDLSTLASSLLLASQDCKNSASNWLKLLKTAEVKRNDNSYDTIVFTETMGELLDNLIKSDAALKARMTDLQSAINLIGLALRDHQE